MDSLQTLKIMLNMKLKMQLDTFDKLKMHANSQFKVKRL